jgi:signal transduction histidine kinase
VVLTIADDGVGFDPAVATTGFGLIGMRERMALAGGSLEVRRGDPGTVIEARVPLLAPARASSSRSPQ